jgi:hypothetical protein
MARHAPLERFGGGEGEKSTEAARGRAAPGSTRDRWSHSVSVRLRHRLRSVRPMVEPQVVGPGGVRNPGTSGRHGATYINTLASGDFRGDAGTRSAESFRRGLPSDLENSGCLILPLGQLVDILLVPAVFAVYDP